MPPLRSIGLGWANGVYYEVLDDTPGDDIETAVNDAPAAADKLTFGERLRILFTGKAE